MTAFIYSIIRTLVPIIVGSVISAFAVAGMQIDKAGEEGLTIFLTGAFISIYYLVVRLLEKRWPGVGILLGVAKTADSYSKGDSPETANVVENNPVAEPPKGDSLF